VFKIISPDQFQTTPCKNGQGVTTELAISPVEHWLILMAIEYCQCSKKTASFQIAGHIKRQWHQVDP